MARVILTEAQRVAVDKAVLKVIRAKGGLRSMDLVKHPEITPALAGLPSTKSDHRHLDSALQRLKGDGQIATGTGRGETHRWFAVISRARGGGAP